MKADATPTTTAAFLEFSRRKLIEQYWPRLRGCVESLTAEQLWWRPNEQSNSIGNIVLHLNGNVRQWLLGPFAQLPDERNRPAEFAQRDAIAPSILLQQLGETLQAASEILARLTEADLLAPYTIQGYAATGLYAVYQVVEHFGMHYGQVLYITKLLQQKDLGFYRELDKTGRRESRDTGREP